jgi:hypothetical protein
VNHADVGTRKGADRHYDVMARADITRSRSASGSGEIAAANPSMTTAAGHHY